VRGSKGVHVAVPRTRVGNQEALTLIAPQDGRVFFVLPSGDQTIIGTTDTYTSESPDAVRASSVDVLYLLAAANAYFPAARLVEDDVIAAWAGIRPLLPAPGSTPGAASREHAITDDARGLVSITGGKLTTYRIMARQAVDRALSVAGLKARRSSTDSEPLPGGDCGDFERAVAEATRVVGDRSLAEHLLSSYGSSWTAVWAVVNADEASRAPLVTGHPYRMGELRWAVRSEFAMTLGDLLIRRLPVAFELRDNGASLAARVAAFVAPELKWSAAAQAAAVGQFQGDIARIFARAGG